MATKRKAVVVGGGVAGSWIAKSLQDELDVTLVDPKDYTEVPYAQLRCIVEPTFAQRSVIQHSDYLKQATVLVNSAHTASDSEIVTASGDHVPYDFLVITTGTEYGGPATRAERLEHFEAENKRLLAAESVLIIGGGPVGVELAGEIVVDFPTKKVTLVHSGERLIEFLGPAASRKTLKWLREKKVEVILDDRIENLENLTGPSYVTKKGIQVHADAHFVCVGKKLATKWLKESVVKDALEAEGRVKVDENLRVEGLTNVFAAGDITNLKEIKQGYLAVKHAAVIADNIKKLAKNPNEQKLGVYKPLEKPFGFVSLGRKLAVGQVPFGTTLGRFAGMFKSKDLFVGKVRKELGLKN